MQVMWPSPPCDRSGVNVNLNSLCVLAKGVPSFGCSLTHIWSKWQERDAMNCGRPRVQILLIVFAVKPCLSASVTQLAAWGHLLTSEFRRQVMSWRNLLKSFVQMFVCFLKCQPNKCCLLFGYSLCWTYSWMVFTAKLFITVSSFNPWDWFQGWFWNGLRQKQANSIIFGFYR